MALALLLLACGTGPDTVRAKLPGHEVEVSVAIPGYAEEKGMFVPGRTIIAGRMANEASISVLWEENFPYVSATECPDAYSKESGFKTFTIDDHPCCQYKVEIRNAIGQSQFYAYVATHDFLITLHVSRAFPLKGAGDAKELKRSEVEGIVKSLALSGDADREKYRYPAEVYAFRDEAAKLSSGQLDWVQQQCSARPDDWVPHFYLGELAYNARKTEPAVRGYQRASDLLVKRADRSAKETKALLVALDTRAACFAGQKKYDQALPVCEQILEVTKGSDAKDAKGFREQALYNLACCDAMTSRPVEAMKALRQAIEAQPEFKKRAAEEPCFASLKTKPDFKKLVAE
jgi:tetratricopeptide (TPR) repeat protein